MLRKRLVDEISPDPCGEDVIIVQEGEERTCNKYSCFNKMYGTPKTLIYYPDKLATCQQIQWMIIDQIKPEIVTIVLSKTNNQVAEELLHACLHNRMFVTTLGTYLDYQLEHLNRDMIKGYWPHYVVDYLMEHVKRNLTPNEIFLYNSIFWLRPKSTFDYFDHNIKYIWYDEAWTNKWWTLLTQDEKTIVMEQNLVDKIKQLHEIEKPGMNYAEYNKIQWQVFAFLHMPFTQPFTHPELPTLLDGVCRYNDILTALFSIQKLWPEQLHCLFATRWHNWTLEQLLRQKPEIRYLDLSTIKAQRYSRWLDDPERLLQMIVNKQFTCKDLEWAKQKIESIIKTKTKLMKVALSKQKKVMKAEQEQAKQKMLDCKKKLEDELKQLTENANTFVLAK